MLQLRPFRATHPLLWLRPFPATTLVLSLSLAAGLGLARASQKGGARRVLASRWLVPVDPETAHPYYGAGFVLHGDGR